MSVYMIVEAKEVLNKEMYMEYVRQVPAIVEKFGGRYLARGGKTTVISGDWHPARLIIVEFESMDNLQSWWNSSEYRKIAPIREQSAKSNAVVVEGFNR